MRTAAVDDRPADTLDTSVPPPTDPPPTDPTPEDRPIHLAKCAECSHAVKYHPLASGHGFTILSGEGAYGMGPNGRPVCPNGHGEMAIADDQLKPVPEAFADAASMLQRASAEASGPVQRSLPGVVPAFNFQGCYMEMEKQAVVVEALRKEYEDDARVAKESKKAWDEAEEKFTKMALEFRRRRQAKDDDAIDPIDTGARSPRREACTWESKHPGETCPLCANEVAPQVIVEVLGHGALPPPDAEAHVLSVDLMNAWLEVQELNQVLTLNLHTYIPESVLAGWSKEDQAAVIAYCDREAEIIAGQAPEKDRLERPAILGTPHIPTKAVRTGDGEAYEPQTCSLCDVELPREHVTDHYEETDFIGVDCRRSKSKKKTPAAKKAAKKKGSK